MHWYGSRVWILSEQSAVCTRPPDCSGCAHAASACNGASSAHPRPRATRARVVLLASLEGSATAMNRHGSPHDSWTMADMSKDMKTATQDEAEERGLRKRMTDRTG
eukprot:scaffold2315_cov145-Isochrysis_galbana.AAC.8